jgi:hypothetical protein
MARRKNTKRQVKKQVEKVAKKYPLLTFIVVLILVAAVIGGYFLHKKGIVNIPFFGEQETSETDEPVGGEVIVTDELSIHFLELGNGNTGDCTLIDIGDTEILIDAGSRKGSAKTIRKYIDQYFNLVSSVESLSSGFSICANTFSMQNIVDGLQNDFYV